MSHEVLMQSIGRLAEAALPRWGLGGADLRMINHSENTTYRVTPAGGGKPVILRVHRPGYHSIDGIRSELAWMRALQAEGGVQTPQAIPGVDGADIQTVTHPGLSGPRNCVLFDFIEGEEPRQDRDLTEPFKQLGEVTARTHLHSMRWQRPAFFERTVWDFEHSLGDKPNWGSWLEGPDMTPARRPLLQRLVDAIGRRLARFGQGPDRFGLIHADFRLANLLIHPSGTPGGDIRGGDIQGGDIRVIDFDDCGLGWFLYDAGTAVSFFEHKPEVPALIDAWAEGYRRVRPLSKEEEAELPTFVILRRMILFAWMGSHSETDLAKQEGPAYAEGTCEMAERYLSRFA
jgi:Ser/Thr protein kinase RdoA (MazF antagonist)